MKEKGSSEEWLSWGDMFKFKVKDYIRELESNLANRKKEEGEEERGEMPLAGEKATELYKKQFPLERETVFKEEILEAISQGEYDDNKELIEAFVNDEIEEYEEILRKYEELIKEKITIGGDPTGHDLYRYLKKHHEIAGGGIRELEKRLGSILESDQRRAAEEDMKTAKDDQKELADILESYGPEIKMAQEYNRREIHSLIDEMEKITGERTLKSMNDRITRLKEIKDEIERADQKDK